MEVEASKKKGDTNTRKKTHQLFAASGCAGGSNPAEEDTPVVEGSPAEGGSPGEPRLRRGTGHSSARWRRSEDSGKEPGGRPEAGPDSLRGNLDT